MISTEFSELSDRLIYAEGVYKTKKAQYDKFTEEVSSLNKEKEVLDKVERLFTHLIDKLAKQDLEKMDQLITYGLKTVFPTKDLKFKSCLEERGKKLFVDMKTIFEGGEVDKDSIGGVSFIESLLLRVLCILKLKKANILLMDETFEAIHNDNLENVSNLLSQLSKKFGIDILLVTHNPGINQYADKVFYAKQTKSKGLEIVALTK